MICGVLPVPICSPLSAHAPPHFCAIKKGRKFEVCTFRSCVLPQEGAGVALRRMTAPKHSLALALEKSLHTIHWDRAAWGNGLLLVGRHMGKHLKVLQGPGELTGERRPCSGLAAACCAVLTPWALALLAAPLDISGAIQELAS